MPQVSVIASVFSSFIFIYVILTCHRHLSTLPPVADILRLLDVLEKETGDTVHTSRPSYAIVKPNIFAGHYHAGGDPTTSKPQRRKPDAWEDCQR